MPSSCHPSRHPLLLLDEVCIYLLCTGMIGPLSVVKGVTYVI